MEYLLKNIDQLDQVAIEALKKAEDRRKWFFYGEIGAGKTTFIQALCRQLGADGLVSSPTFSIVNEYQKQDSNQRIYHIDLYRLKDIDEALDIGIEDYLYNDDYCFVEWPQIVEAVAPPGVVKINIEILEDSYRKIIFL
ncbi:MAG: tRNA (adenosine(37)-N6)-threonylcarbamoyltransferase complex ATPase subunit type 1 TsaE [Bacteroidota bacterium]